MRKAQVFLLLLTGLSGACSHEEVSPEGCDFGSTSQTLQIFTNAEGVIRLSNEFYGIDTYYLDLTKCEACSTIVRPNPKGLIVIPGILPCNLPSRFKEDGLLVTFSGNLKINTRLNYELIDFNGLPIEISRIERR